MAGICNEYTTPAANKARLASIIALDEVAANDDIVAGLHTNSATIVLGVVAAHNIVLNDSPAAAVYIESTIMFQATANVVGNIAFNEVV